MSIGLWSSKRIWWNEKYAIRMTRQSWMSNDWISFELMNFYSWFEEIRDARTSLADQAERVHLKLVQDFGKVVLKMQTTIKNQAWLLERFSAIMYWAAIKNLKVNNTKQVHMVDRMHDISNEDLVYCSGQQSLSHGQLMVLNRNVIT